MSPNFILWLDFVDVPSFRRYGSQQTWHKEESSSGRCNFFARCKPSDEVEECQKFNWQHVQKTCSFVLVSSFRNRKSLLTQPRGVQAQRLLRGRAAHQRAWRSSSGYSLAETLAYSAGDHMYLFWRNTLPPR